MNLMPTNKYLYSTIDNYIVMVTEIWMMKLKTDKSEDFR